MTCRGMDGNNTLAGRECSKTSNVRLRLRRQSVGENNFSRLERERTNGQLAESALAEIALGVMNQFARSVGQSEGCLGRIDRTLTAPIAAAATRPRVLPAVIQKPISA